MKKFLKWSLIVTLFTVTIVLVSAHFYLNSQSFKETVLSLIEEKSGFRCEVQTLKVSLTGKVKLQEITVSYGSEPHFLTVEEVRGELSLGDLIGGDYYPQLIQAQAIDLHLAGSPETGWNIPLLDEKMPLTAPMEINLIRAQARAEKLRTGLNYQIQFDFNELNATPIPNVENLTLRARYEEPVLTIDGFNTALLEGVATGKGALTFDFDPYQPHPVKSGALDFELKNINLGELTSYIPQLKGLQVLGQGNVHVKPQINAFAPSADLYVTASKLSLRHPLTDDLLNYLKERPDYLLFNVVDLHVNVPHLKRILLKKLTLENLKFLSVYASGELLPNFDDFEQSTYHLPVKLQMPYKRIKIRDLQSPDEEWAILDLDLKGEIGNLPDDIQRALIQRTIKMGTDRLQKELDRHNITIGGEKLDVNDVLNAVEKTLNIDLNQDGSTADEPSDEEEAIDPAPQEEKLSVEGILGEVLRQQEAREKEQAKEEADPNYEGKDDKDRVIEGLFNLLK